MNLHWRHLHFGGQLTLMVEISEFCARFFLSNHSLEDATGLYLFISVLEIPDPNSVSRKSLKPSIPLEYS